MRFAPIAVLMLVLSLAPATAFGHPGHDGAAAMSLRAAARVCADYTPKAEARRNRLERLALGAGHAADHARARAQSRRQSCTSRGRLKKSFVTKVRGITARAAKRSHAVGPASQVGQWSGTSHIDVTGVHAVLLPTGKVLYFNYGPSETGIAAIWDPATRTSHRTDPSTGENIWCAGQTLLADGRVLVVGGNIPKTGANFRGLDSIYIFDPWTETWSFQGRMNEGRWYPTTTLLPNGQVVITSGLRRDGSGTINPDVDVFTPNPSPTGIGTITTVNQKVFNLYPHQFVVRDGKMLVAGPFPGDVGLLNPNGWTWSSVPALRANHYYGSAVLLPDGPNGSSKVMIISGDQQASTEVIDEENLGAGWSNRAPLPVHRRNANSVLTPDGALITIGGNGTNNFDAPRFEALRYDPAANAWTELAAQAEPRGYHSTALLLPDGRIVSAGDDGPAGGGGQSDEVEIFSPPYLFKTARPTITSAPAQIGFGAQFTVGSVETDVTSAVLVAPGATTHANDMHQRLIPLTMSPVSGGYALTAPPSANAAPPGHYMLFLVNGQGVPSVARFIRLVSGPPPPPDTTPPTVAVSAPAAGATVSGTTPVSATASDNVGVVGVQFTLDGANLGAEDTSAPYSVSWNTTTASNGAHALRAIARDAATNSTTSTPVGVTVSNTTPPPPTGLVGAYGFEETSGSAVTDSSPAGNPGTIAGAAARTAAGKIGRAIDFDGVNDYVSVADAASLDLSTGMTLEAWVQLDTVSSWRTTILKEKPGGLVYALYANSSSARPQGEIVTGAGAGTDRVAGIGPALGAGTWTHLALTYDNAQLRLYRNGVQVTQTASTGAIQASANPLRIGGNAIWGEYTDGRIDEVRIYNRALSAAEITADMTTPVGGGSPPPPDATPPTVAVSAPAAGATLSGTTPVSATASDNVGVVGVQFTLDGANLGAEDTSAPYSVSWNTTTASNGAHSLRAIARDAATNSTTSAPVGVTVSNAAPDTTPPTVAVSAPAAGATLSGTTPVSATASDNVGVVGVQFTLDGANLGAEDTSAPYSVSWNTTTASNGAHALRAIARDAATNSTTSTPVNVTVSNTTPPPPTGLVGAYGFEETSGSAVTDSSPAGNPGTIAGAAARTAAGKIGRAIDFDGVNDYVSVADAASLDLSTGMTLEAWVQLDTVSSWRTTILKEKPGGLVYALYANSSSARPQGEIVTGAGAGTDRVAGIGPPLGAGTWTHLALTYDNAQLRLYRNGVQVTQTASTGAIQASANPLRIGGNAIWGEYTDGRIDEVRIYNRALSAAEITTDMTRPVV